MKKNILFISLLIPGLLSAQWTQSNGPLGSSISCYSLNGPYDYIGTIGGGIFRSIDDGLTWTNKSYGIMLPFAPSSECVFVNAIAAGPSYVYAGTNYGFFSSSNEGDSWNDVSNNMVNNHVNEIILDGATIYAGTASGVEVSTNNGTSWTNMSTGIPGGTSIDDMTLNGTEMFVGTPVGVFYSNNNGTNWMNVGFVDTAISTIEVRGTTVLASTIYGLWRSTNNGASWINTGSFGNELTLMGTDFYCASYGGGVYRSTDDGITWNAVNTDLTNLWITAINNDGTTLYAGSAYTNAYFSTNNGASWVVSNEGITHTDVYALHSYGGNVYAGTLGAGVGKTTNNGTTWTTSTNGLLAFSTIGCEFINALVENSAGIFAGTSAGMFLSTDNGVNWNPINTGFLSPTNITSLLYYNSKVYAGTLDGVYMTTDNGANWSHIGLAGQYIFSLAHYGTDIMAGATGGVHYTMDDGANWNFQSTGFLPFNNILSIWVAGSEFYAGTFPSGVYKSTDSGNNWTNVSNGLPTLPVNSIISDGTQLFAGVGAVANVGGVYASTDLGANWHDISWGMINRDIRALTHDGTNIYAGTHGSGVWQTTLASIHVGIEENENNSVQLYPNPVLDVFMIDQTTLMDKYTQLTILDIEGKFIKQMALQGDLTSINVDGLPSGNYLVKMEADHLDPIYKKMIKN